MRDWVSYLLWLLVGAGAVLGLVGIASIGVFVLPATVVVLSSRSSTRRAEGPPGCCSARASSSCTSPSCTARALARCARPTPSAPRVWTS